MPPISWVYLCLYSATRLLTNVFKRFGAVLSHASTMDESVQKIHRVNSISNELFTLSKSLARISAPQSSSFGIVSDFSGATLDFPHSKFTEIFPS